MRPLPKLILGLLGASLYFPIGFILLMFCVAGVSALYRFYLNSWQQGSDLLWLALSGLFSWQMIKFYLLAWGFGLLMVCSMAYSEFKPSIHQFFRRLK